MTLDLRTLEQGSDAWLIARRGHVTASGIAAILSKGKGDAISATRRKYMVQLAVERMTGRTVSTYTNAAMQWGIDQEPFAAIAYEVANETFATRTGFWLHPTIPWLGVSPDRLVGDGGLVEIKCPETTTHIDYLLNDRVPPEYVAQIQCQLWVTNRAWCDFVSFDPRMPEHSQLFIVRMQRDDEFIANMESTTIAFLDDVQTLITTIEKRAQQNGN